MKKTLIALLLAVVMASGNIGNVPVMAAETTEQDSDQVQGEVGVSAEEEAISMNEAEGSSIVEDASVEEIAEVTEGTPVQQEEETVEETEQTEVQEVVEEDATTGEDSVAVEDAVTEDEAETVDEDQGNETVAPDTDEIGVKDTEINDTSTLKKEGDASDVVDSGTCGENATWMLTGTDNNLTLTINGSGNMMNYNDNATPWASYNDKIRIAVVEDGITRIGSYAFSHCTNLENISIPESVTELG